MKQLYICILLSTAINGVESLVKSYRSLQMACQPFLFLLFTCHTLIVILIGYLLTIMNQKCVDPVMRTLEKYIIYGVTMVTSVFVLGYCGFIMDRAFRQFQDLADRLRYRVFS